ncbi:D-2-hydroxyacid dehydrogenase [Massilia sp. TS11]|uniref:D-2-hydroxyacid dehydrogenase n=1 Tax=Massilia sp. TS11 TaxID=2908003 RepID=UPI001EDB290F|nr:D-2-hydroxyacid dehydrogenase [Massilia sp. TS11]MCG2584467.1 D-2-hydroxyacid dehydrogenase [Massilia sp. TS11]
MHDIVFLDRATLIAQLRAPGFAHRWTDYDYSTPDQVVERLAGASIAVTNKVRLNAAQLDQLPQLRMIAVAATGTDIIDLDACRARGIAVANVRNYSQAAVPEHVFMLMLALRRQLLAYHADVRAGRWQQAPAFCLFDRPLRDLAGSRLGIIGYGVLGQSVARLARAFGMEVVVHSRRPVPDETNLDLESLLRSADVVSLHLPLSAATRHLIGARELGWMKPDSLLINTARGGLVDEQALAEALRAGRIGGAGFDVLSQEPPTDSQPLLSIDQPNFILTPHNAWASAGSMQRLADILIENIEAFAAGRPLNRL